MATGTIIPPGEYLEDEQEIVTESQLTAYEEAERTSQVTIAKKYPRSMTFFRRELAEIASMSQPVALEMMYSVPRAGKQLIGPSVRFAEAVLSCWGNCHAAVRIKDVAGDFIIAESAFFDAEKNSRITVEVKRRITDKNNKRFNADMIGVTGAAASSIALRGAILRGVPKALWNDLFEKAKSTAAGDVASLAKTREEKVALFRALGVTDAMLLNALKIPGIADIGSEEIVAMAAWHKQLINKECALEDIFGSSADEEIERLMEELGWNGATKTMARGNYTGRRDELLEHVRTKKAEADKAKGTTAAPAAKKAVVAADPTPTNAAVEQSTTSAPDTKTQESASAASGKPSTTAAASTSQASRPKAKPSEDW